jgi:hypothetical protein
MKRVWVIIGGELVGAGTTGGLLPAQTPAESLLRVARLSVGDHGAAG